MLTQRPLRFLTATAIAVIALPLLLAATAPAQGPAAATLPATGPAAPSATAATQPAASVPPNPAAVGTALVTIKKAIETRFAGVKVLDVKQSPISGLYEVYLGDRIVYADATGDHVIVGSLIDSRTQTDITQAHLDERGAIDFKSLPFDKAIKITKGSGAYPLAVFEDPDCPFCQKLEKELATVNDTTVYVFLFPIDALHPQATLHSREIWCAPDRAQAWTQWLTQRKSPGNASCKGDPVEALAKLGNDLHIDGTPTMFFASGKRVPGAISTDEIKKLLMTQTPKS
jgi:thiol:disulfide interchange protein DsbC